MSFNINLKQPQKPKIRIKNEPTINDSIGFDGNVLSQKPKEVINVEFGNTARDKMLQKEIKELRENTDNKFEDVSTQIDKITLDNEDLTQRVEKVEDDVEHIDTKIDSKIAVESTARINADRLLQTNITNESTIRQQEDEKLQDAIDHIDLTPVYDAINQEATARENADTRIEGKIDTHIANTSNPHSVTKEQVGLGDVVNTGDSATPSENGTTKFTTGGAYTLKNDLENKINNIARTYTNVTVLTSAFEQDATYEDFPYKAVVVEDNYLIGKVVKSCYLVFNMADSISGNYASIFNINEVTGEITIYAKEIPQETLVISSIVIIF